MANLTLDLGKVGAHVGTDGHGTPTVTFGLYLPGITGDSGVQISVLVIHKDDHFAPGISPKKYQLDWTTGVPYDFWSTTVPLVAPAVDAGTYGQPGTYLYRYQFRNKDNAVVVEWCVDPFALATDIGELGAFDVPSAGAFPWTDEAFDVPAIEDCVVYEMQVEEFNDTFDGVVERLPYLTSLGVNVLELMPVSSPKHEFDWGYGPLHFFAPNARCGGVGGLKRLVDACHKAGVAVILDVVYQHVGRSFPYKLIYDAIKQASPMIDGDGQYGPQADWSTSKPFTKDYFLAANAHWLDDYHIDGFRYDNVDGYYYGPATAGYADLVYCTYNYVKDRSAQYPRLTRKATAPASRIIQCAEALDQPQGILRDTYSNATWQDGTLHAARALAQAGFDAGALDTFIHALDIRSSGYQDTNGIPELVAPLQYLDSHDHSYLITAFGAPTDFATSGGESEDSRGEFARLQPFVIALYTCTGVPMLWQGQEIGECYTLADNGNLRINFRRDVRWEFFYDKAGQTLITLYRTLGGLRRDHRALRGRELSYDPTLGTSQVGVVIYSRHAPAVGDSSPEETAVICLNFSDRDQTVQVPFPRDGEYREMVDGQSRGGTPYNISASAGERRPVTVPSHYGFVFIAPAPRGSTPQHGGRGRARD